MRPESHRGPGLVPPGRRAVLSPRGTRQRLADLMCGFHHQPRFLQLQIYHKCRFHIACQNLRSQDPKRMAGSRPAAGNVIGCLQVQPGFFGKCQTFGDAHDRMSHDDLIWLLGYLPEADRPAMRNRAAHAFKNGPNLLKYFPGTSNHN